MRLTVVVALVLLCAGCGSDDADDGRAATTKPAASGATPLPAVTFAELDPGKPYVSQKFTPKITLTMPTGKWELFGDVPDHVEIEAQSEQPVDGAGISFHHMTEVFDPAEGGQIPGDAVPGPDDFAEWLTTHPHLTATKPKRIEALGLSGVSIDVRVKSGQSKRYKDCGKVEGNACVVMFNGAIEPIVSGKSGKTRFLVLEQPDGKQLVVELWVDPAGEFDTEVERLEQVVASASIATR